MNARELIERVILKNAETYQTPNNYKIYINDFGIMFGIYEDDYKIRVDIINLATVKIDKNLGEDNLKYKDYLHSKIRKIKNMLRG